MAASLASTCTASFLPSLCTPSPCSCGALLRRPQDIRQQLFPRKILTSRRRIDLSPCSLVISAAAVLSKAPEQLDVSKLEPLGDRLLIKPEESKKESDGGVLLTSGTTQTMQDAVIGKVLAKGEEVDISVNVGDTVLFSTYSTSDVKVPDGEVIFAAQKSVLAVLS